MSKQRGIGPCRWGEGRKGGCFLPVLPPPSRGDPDSDDTRKHDCEVFLIFLFWPHGRAADEVQINKYSVGTSTDSVISGISSSWVAYLCWRHVVALQFET